MVIHSNRLIRSLPSFPRAIRFLQPSPQNLVAAVLAGATPGSALVDLSWSINLETDLGGYRVYRSEQQDTRGALLTPDSVACTGVS